MAELADLNPENTAGSQVWSTPVILERILECIEPDVSKLWGRSDIATPSKDFPWTEVQRFNWATFAQVNKVLYKHLVYAFPGDEIEGQPGMTEKLTLHTYLERVGASAHRIKSYGDQVRTIRWPMLSGRDPTSPIPPVESFAYVESAHLSCVYPNLRSLILRLESKTGDPEPRGHIEGVLRRGVDGNLSRVNLEIWTTSMPLSLDFVTSKHVATRNSKLQLEGLSIRNRVEAQLGWNVQSAKQLMDFVDPGTSQIKRVLEHWSLKSLDIVDVPLPLDDVRKLLQRSPELRRLAFRIGQAADIAFLGEVAKACPTLEHLHIRAGRGADREVCGRFAFALGVDKLATKLPRLRTLRLPTFERGTPVGTFMLSSLINYEPPQKPYLASCHYELGASHQMGISALDTAFLSMASLPYDCVVGVHVWQKDSPDGVDRATAFAAEYRQADLRMRQWIAEGRLRTNELKEAGWAVATVDPVSGTLSLRADHKAAGKTGRGR